MNQSAVVGSDSDTARNRDLMTRWQYGCVETTKCNKNGGTFVAFCGVGCDALFFLSGKNDFRTSDSLFKQDPLVTVSRGAKGDGKGCGMPERKGQRGVRLVLSRSWSAPS